MAAPDHYRTPLSYKQALEAKIRTAADGRINRFRQLLIFDRLLARLFRTFGERVMLKGGIVLELRLGRARTTKDIDLRLVGSTVNLLEQLRDACRLDLGDWLEFEIAPDPRHPRMQGAGQVYQGQRFRVQARLAGKDYGGLFGLDVGVADAMTADAEIVEGSSFLEFVGAEAERFRIYPRVTHVAEKLHAYTLPTDRENTRVKDLPDLALLAQTGAFGAEELRSGIEATFAFRDSHQIPDSLPTPPESWERPYARMAEQDELRWTTLTDVFQAASGFLNPILANTSGTWSPDAWDWSA